MCPYEELSLLLDQLASLPSSSPQYARVLARVQSLLAALGEPPLFI